MSTSTLTVTSTWSQILDVPFTGYFSLFIEELADSELKATLIFSETGTNSASETNLMNPSGITLINFGNRILPITFYMHNNTSRTYELRRISDKLEIRLTSGTDISVRFTVVSASPDKTIVLIPSITEIDKTSYKRIMTYSLPHMKRASVKAVSWMNSDVTSYTFLVFDKTNRATLLEATLNNITEQEQTVGVLSNLPANSTQIEIMVKKTGGANKSVVYVESLSIDYN